MLKGVLDLLGGQRANVFSASAIVTALPTWNGTALGGPLLYNGSPLTGGGRGVTAYLLAMSWGLSVASTVAGAIGITGGLQSSANPLVAPTPTTAITTSGNLRLGANAPTPQCSVYSTGTVSAAPTIFLPVGHVHTGAITVDTDDDNMVPLGSLIEIDPGYFACPAASATLTGSTIQIGLVWAEIARG